MSTMAYRGGGRRHAQDPAPARAQFARRIRTASTKPQLATGPQKWVVRGPVGLRMRVLTISIVRAWLLRGYGTLWTGPKSHHRGTVEHEAGCAIGWRAGMGVCHWPPSSDWRAGRVARILSFAVTRPAPWTQSSQH